MSYEVDLRFEEALKSLYDAGKYVCENVFTGDRPAAVPKQMEEFIVVSIPGTLESTVCGGGYGNVPTYCNIEIYVRLKKGGSEDIPRMNSICRSLLEMFPISDNAIKATRPRLMLKGNDGLGFSASLIRAELLIK